MKRFCEERRGRGLSGLKSPTLAVRLAQRQLVHGEWGDGVVLRGCRPSSRSFLLRH